MKKHKYVVAVSGGFDPIHVGHLRMFNKAKTYGDELVVILNNDNWLMAKKGFVFMPESERAELLLGLKPVDRVVISGHRKSPKDMSVSAELLKIKPDIFANGGDRKKGNTPEGSACEIAGCKMIFGIGGGKIQSSSWLLSKYKERKK